MYCSNICSRRGLNGNQKSAWLVYDVLYNDTMTGNDIKCHMVLVQ